MLGAVSDAEVVTIVGVILTTSGGIIVALIKVGSSLGRVAQILEDLTRRVDRLENFSFVDRRKQP